MNMPDRRDQSIREIMVIDDPDTMRMILSGKYNDVLELIDSHEMSVTEIAKTLKINPGSAHYHLKELEKRGLVKIVREETKGNMVKKYYRASARNFYLNGSRFKTLSPGEINPMDEYFDRLFKLMSPFGYNIPPEKAGAIKDAFMRYDKRRKEIILQIQDMGIEKNESDRLLVTDAYSVAIRFREIEDKTLIGINEELRALLSEAGKRQ